MHELELAKMREARAEREAKALDKVKKLPKYIVFKVLARILKNKFGSLRARSGINPQDNKANYGRLYSDLISYYEDCGRSDAAVALYDARHAAP